MLVRKLLGIYREPKLIVYRSFVNTEHVHVTGRIIERTKQSTSRSLLGNIGSVFRAYLARPYAHEEITIFSDHHSCQATTNENGVFESVCPYHKDDVVKVQYKNQSVPVEIVATADSARFGIISDVDDTILISNVTRTIKLLYLVFTKNAHSRKPFPGVAEFYQALANPSNPIFYVSSTTWNLYDMLVEFMSINHIPKGPLLLKQISNIKALYTTAGRHNHKQDKIEMILETYPHLSFILLGDSGQKDVQIYSDIAKKYSGRIKVIYIRDIFVKKNRIEKTVVSTAHGDVDVVFVKTSEEAAIHARAQGFIKKSEEQHIKEGVAQEL